MKFISSRTSGDEDDLSQKPCEEAIQEEVTGLERRFVPTIKCARRRKWFKEWYDSGLNHREEKAYGERNIVCDQREKTTVWVIELNSLVELSAFHEKYGAIILLRSAYKEIPLEIEIYDGYRE